MADDFGELGKMYVKIQGDVTGLKKDIDGLKKSVTKDVQEMQQSADDFSKKSKAAFDGINPSVKELQKRLEQLRQVMRTSHQDSKAYAIASRESEIVLAKLGETTDVTSKKSRSFREGLRTLATQFFNTAGAGSGMGSVLSTLAYGIFSGGGILAAAGAATLAFQLLTKSQNESKEATINQIGEIKKLSDELDNMSRKELMRQMVKNMFEISRLETEAKANIQNQLKTSSQSSLGGSVVVDLDPIKSLTAEQQEQLRLLKEQNTIIDLLITNRSVLKGIDAEISDLRKQQNAVTEEDLRNDPKKLKNLQDQIDGLEKYAKVLRGIKDDKTVKTTVFKVSDIKAKSLGYDKDSLKREEQYLNDSLNLNKLKRGELVFFMQETNQVMLDDSMFTTEAIFQDWLAKNQAIQESLDVVRQLGSRAFDELRIRASTNASAIENLFVDMGNIIINKLKEIAVQWALMGFARLLFGGITGGASLALPVGHSGGNFIGTSSGVKKMAGGGSFIVPPGFPNDSYPLLVESGERVTVNPTNQVGNQDRMLRSIHRSLQNLNALTADGQMLSSRSKTGAIPIVGEIDNDVIRLSNQKATKTKNRYT